MALVNCIECGRGMSDKAVSCPGCGAPPVTGASLSGAVQSNKRKTSPVAWAALVGLVLGLGWLQFRESKEQSLPPLPVEVKYRSALLGPGMVLHVNNTADKPLFAMVTLSNPTTQVQKSFRIDMAAKGSAEIGHQEGWILASGDSFNIINNSFRTYSGSIP